MRSSTYGAASDWGCSGMRFALGIFGSALVLFVAGAVGALGSWALAAGAVALLVASVCGATALETRDLDREQRALRAL